MVTIMVAIDAADVPMAAYSAVVILFFCFFDIEKTCKKCSYDKCH